MEQVCCFYSRSGARCSVQQLYKVNFELLRNDDDQRNQKCYKTIDGPQSSYERGGVSKYGHHYRGREQFRVLSVDRREKPRAFALAPIAPVGG